MLPETGVGRKVGGCGLLWLQSVIALVSVATQSWGAMPEKERAEAQGNGFAWLHSCSVHARDPNPRS